MTPRIGALLLSLACAGCAQDDPLGEPLVDDASVTDTGMADARVVDGSLVDLAFEDAFQPPQPEPEACGEPSGLIECNLAPDERAVDESCPVDPALSVRVDARGPLSGEFTGVRAVRVDHRLIGGPHHLARWRLEGRVPPGVDIDPCTGRVDGTLHWPADGPLAVVAEVEDAAGCRSARVALETAVEACQIAVEPREVDLPAARLGEAYDTFFEFWSPEGVSHGRVRVAAGELPPGLFLDCDGSRIVGEPEVAGRFEFQLEWVEYTCGGVTGVDRIAIEIIDPNAPDPNGCEACGPEELCVVFSDGACDNSRPRCVPDPANCRMDGCTEACEALVCNTDPEGVLHSCDAQNRCVGDPFFNCWGP